MDNKKLAAAMAAVTMFIKTGEEDAAVPCAEETFPDISTLEASSSGLRPNLWGVSGRQALMNGSAMMQMRLFK